VPVLFARGKADHIAGADFLDRAAQPLHPAKARRDDQRLAQRMGMPSGAGARLEGDAGALHAVGRCGIEQRVNADAPGEPIGWPGTRGDVSGAKNVHAVSCQIGSCSAAAGPRRAFTRA